MAFAANAIASKIENRYFISAPLLAETVPCQRIPDRLATTVETSEATNLSTSFQRRPVFFRLPTEPISLDYGGIFSAQ
jgi:hypothetical protein